MAGHAEVGPHKKTRPPFRIRGIVFDLDGTLIHSAPDIAAALNIVLGERGLPVFSIPDACRFVGAGARRLVADALAARGQLLSDGEIDHLTEHYLATYRRRGSPDTTLYPGVRETLARLRSMGIPIAVCTNKAEAISRDVLGDLDVEQLFVAVIGGDSGYGRKPDPGPLVEVCRRIGTDPAHIIMVGDTKMDVGAARSAGASVIIATYGYSQVPVEELRADMVIEDFSTLIELVRLA